MSSKQIQVRPWALLHNLVATKMQTSPGVTPLDLPVYQLIIRRMSANFYLLCPLKN